MFTIDKRREISLEVSYHSKSIIPDTVRCTTAASQTIQVVAATTAGITVTAAQ